MAEKQRALIIGAGAKGARSSVSHALGLKTAGYEIIGFVDNDHRRATLACEKWGGKPYTSVLDALDGLNVNLITVAVPDEAQEDVVRAVIGHADTVLCEKPFTKSYVGAKALVEYAVECSTSLVINYTRQFSHSFQQLQGLIKDRELGDFLGGSGFYGNGLYHNGSHMINLLLMLFGKVDPIGPFQAIADTKLDDPTLYGMLEVDKSPFYLGCVPRSCVNAFELTLFFTKAKVKISDVGRKIEIFGQINRYDVPSEQLYKTKAYELQDFRHPIHCLMDYIQEIDFKNDLDLVLPALNTLKILDEMSRKVV